MVKVVSRVLEVRKSVKYRNRKTGNVSISHADLVKVFESDTVILIAFDPDGKELGTRLMTGKQFHEQLVPRLKKNNYGPPTRYYTLKY